MSTSSQVDRLLRERENIRTGLERHVYVLEFTSGTIKVGQTRKPANRFKEHAKAAEVHGHSIVRSWASEQHAEFDENELALIAFCVQRWEPASGREAFVGADFDSIVEFAKGLPYSRVPESELDVRQERIGSVAGQLHADRQHRIRMERIAELGKTADLIASLANNENRLAACDAAYEVAKELVAILPAPWADEDPTAAERYLLSRGTRPELARKNAAEFELNFRALYLIEYHREPESFDDIAEFCNRVTAPAGTRLTVVGGAA